jgi:CBS domain-containing protein
MNVETILKSKGSSVVTVAPGDTVAHALSVLEAHEIGAVVVSPDRVRVEGILSERDIVRELARQGAGILDSKLGEIMTREVYVCEPDDTVAELMAQMTDRRIRHLPVVVEGRLKGIISIGDVVKNRLGEVESEKDALREYIVRG